MFLEGEWEDDTAKTIPRMSCHQDFGLKDTTSKVAFHEHAQNAPLGEVENKVLGCIAKDAAPNGLKM